MVLYLYCYARGEGYELKRTVFPALPPLEDISQRTLPETEAEIFTGTAAPYLFLGTVEGRRFGCVREVETAMRDENGRRCFIHIALEAEGEEAELVDAALRFALERRSRFVNLCNRLIVSKPGDYALDPDAFGLLLSEAEAFGGQEPEELLIPQTSAEDFFANAGHACQPEAFTIPCPFENWKIREEAMELFLYCSTPSSGFVLSEIDPATGERVRNDKDAGDRMVPWSRSILTQSGAVLSLFRQDGKVCFVARDIQSTSADHYGRKKKMSLVMQAAVENSLPVRQAAAWALVDFSAFSQSLTGCVKVFDGPRGYEVQPGKLSPLLDQLSRPIRLPEENSYHIFWDKVCAPPDERPFSCLVCEATLSYFCRNCNISITEEDVRLLINEEAFQNLRRKPAGIAFTPELYFTPENRNASGKKARISGKETASVTSITKETDASATTKKPETDTSAAKKSETGVSAAKEPETNTSAAKKSKTGASAAKKPETETSAAKKSETGASAAKKPETETSAAKKSETDASAAKKPETETSAAKKSETDVFATKRSETGTSAAKRPERNSSAGESGPKKKAVPEERPSEKEWTPPEEERIDLMQQKWFWPVVGLLALAVIGGAALWLYLRGSGGAEEQQVLDAALGAAEAVRKGRFP